MSLGLLGEIYEAVIIVRTNGQFGQPYCIVAGFSSKEVMDLDNHNRFIAKCPIEERIVVDKTDTSKMFQNYKSYKGMLKSFIDFYQKRIHHETRVVVCGSTMALDRLFADAYKFGFIDSNFSLPEYVMNIASNPDIIFPQYEDDPFSGVLLYRDSKNEWHEKWKTDPKEYEGKVPMYEFQIIIESYYKWFYQDWWPFCYESRRYSEKRYLPFYIKH